MHARTLLAVPLVLALAGCTFGGSAEESGEGSTSDRDEYHDGAGLALVLQNDAQHMVNVTIRVVDLNGAVMAKLTREVAPNATYEKWLQFDPTIYNVHMSYGFQPAPGHASTGMDQQQVDLSACEALTQAGWRYLPLHDSVASQVMPHECIDAEG